MAQGPEVDTAGIVGRADRRGRQRRTGAGDVVIVFPILVTQKGGLALAEIMVELDLLGAMRLRAREGCPVVRCGEIRPSEVRQREEQLLDGKRLRAEQRSGDYVSGEVLTRERIADLRT